mmetsp:Transcript_6140/g.11267  ORF Transcript_6140/g.11267 Transcript_6140/m.11267 type:complete len:97 (-) Transcript_6140:25-315(-)
MLRGVPRFVRQGAPRTEAVPDSVQWGLTIGLGTLLPGLALIKCFYVTGAVEAERGVEEELSRNRHLRDQADSLTSVHEASRLRSSSEQKRKDVATL